jgi:hypothetical protein
MALPLPDRGIVFSSVGCGDSVTVVVDVHSRLPALSTYLGHLNPAYTYYYLSAAPQLLAHAAGMLDAALEARP